MKVILFKIAVVVVYTGVLLVNFLANYLPFNNRSTGDISDSYASYFTPSGFTFSIWGVIYIMLGAFVIQVLTRDPAWFDGEYVTSLLLWFAVSSLFNMLWLVTWHYDWIGWSVVVMLGLLVSLIFAYLSIPTTELLIKAAFSLYLGWISVATIANVTILLVKLDWPFFLNQATLWFVIVLLVGVVLVGTVLFVRHDVLYGVVFVWAYFGILMKHLNKELMSFDARGPVMYNVAMLGVIAILVLITLYQNGYQLYRG